MAKRILYIDPISPAGHKMYNDILIRDIANSGCNLDLISKSHYFDYLCNDNLNIKQVLEIDEKYYSHLDEKRSIINRINYFKIIIQIKKNIDFSKYDYVIFSSYEEISFFFANIKFKCYLVNHNNLSGIDNFIKRYIIKKISKDNRLLVLHEKFVDLLNKRGINSIYIPHGLPQKIINSFSITYNKNSFFKKELIIFSPSSSSSDIGFFRELINDFSFVNFLEQNNILLILKGNYVAYSDSILILNNFLEKKDYEYFFNISNIILINYNQVFKNRVSGVFYESIANDKIILTSKHFFDSVAVEEKGVYVFNDIGSLHEILKEIIKQRLYAFSFNRDKKAYEPNIIQNIENDK